MLRKIICGVANHHSSLQLWCLRIKIRVQLQLGKALLGHHAELRNGTVSQPSVACRAVPFPFTTSNTFMCLLSWNPKAPVIFKFKTASALECLIQFGGKKAESFSDFLLSNAVTI